MAWPPTKPGSGSSNTTPQLNTHPDLHNDTRTAIDDIEGKVNAVSAVADTAAAGVDDIRTVFDDENSEILESVQVVSSGGSVQGNLGVAPKWAADATGTDRTLTTTAQDTGLSVTTFDAPAGNSLVIIVGTFDFEVDGNAIAIGELSTNNGVSFWAEQALFRSVDSARCTVTKVWVGTNAASWTAKLYVRRSASGSGSFYATHSSLQAFTFPSFS